MIVAAQAVRALAYGLGSVVVGVSLARRGLSAAEVGAVLAALLAGAALVSALVSWVKPWVLKGECWRWTSPTACCYVREPPTQC